MAKIPDISDTERWLLETTLKERYGRAPQLQLADAEIRLSPSDRELTGCPMVLWQDEQDCNFVIFKTGDRRYRCQFFYRGYQQYGTGVKEYDDLSECVVSLLQAQADHVVEERGDLESERSQRP